MITLTEWSSVEVPELTAAQVQALARTSRFELRPAASAGQHWRLTATQYVGVTRFGDLQVKVVPKVGVHRLVELLCTTLDRVFWDEQDVVLGDADDLVRFIAQAFVRRAERTIAAGILQGYRTVDESMYGLRGRIDQGRQLTRGRGLPLPLEVTYDDYTIDVLENRLLSGAARVLLRLGGLPAGITAGLRRLEVRLDGVTPTRPAAAVPPVTWTRLNARYRPAVALARLILQNSSIDTDTSPTATAAAFIVDMNVVFEDVVGHGLRDALAGTDVEVHLQHDDYLDLDRRVKIRPDVVLRDGSGVVGIADVKYKRPTARGVDPSDVYQVVAYATRYGLDEVGLIFAEPPPVPELRVGGVRVRLRHLDLRLPAPERAGVLAELAGELMPVGVP